MIRNSLLCFLFLIMAVKGFQDKDLFFNKMQHIFEMVGNTEACTIVSIEDLDEKFEGTVQTML